MDPSSSKPIRKLRRQMMLTLLVLVITPILLWIFLFRANRFSLEIRLLGEENMVIAAGSEFIDPGAEAYMKGTLIARKGIKVAAEIIPGQQVNSAVPGTYFMTYDADWHGSCASTARSVTVRDMQPPEITLHFTPGAFTIPGEQYQEEGYSARDNIDGDITAYVTRVTDAEFVTYVVVDQAGNRSSIRRKIHYYDPIAPEITLLGDVTVYMDAGTEYKEPGWIAVDNSDGDISQLVKVDNQVDKYRAGTYPVIYTVQDSTGNEIQAVRNVVVEPIGIPKTVTPEEKVIYLTFDDGPGPYTRDLLKILAKYDAKATFFVVNSEYNALMSDIVEGGHAIGIHSVSHSYRTIYASAEAFFQDLLAMQQIIYDQTGVRTCLMRFPGGSSNTVSKFNPGIMSYLVKAVEDNGFRYFDWNVDSDDAGRAKNAKEVFENVTEGADGRRICIVLQHDIKDFSVEAVEKILIWGLENGYEFRCLDMTSPMAHHGTNN